MAEVLTLTTPVTKASQTTWRLDRLTVDYTQGSVFAQFLGNNGEIASAAYPTPAPAGSSQPTGAQLITTLNTANLTSNSLNKRAVQRAQTDGYLAAGTVSGTPD